MIGQVAMATLFPLYFPLRGEGRGGEEKGRRGAEVSSRQRLKPTLLARPLALPLSPLLPVSLSEACLKQLAVIHLWGLYTARSQEKT